MEFLKEWLDPPSGFKLIVAEHLLGLAQKMMKSGHRWVHNTLLSSRGDMLSFRDSYSL